MEHKDIDGWRTRINDIDAELLTLLQQRAECSHNIGSIKKSLGQEVFVPAREQEVLDRLVTINKGLLPEKSIRTIFSSIMSESRSIQKEL